MSGARGARSRSLRAALAGGLVLGALISAASPGHAQAVPPTPPTGSVEAHFAQSGPYGAVHEDVVDSFGDTPYEIFTPKDLGADGERHPVIAWGNGTIARPVEYTGILTHLASWGFVVIASTSDQTGTGNEILASIRRVTRMGDDPSSRLFHHVDGDRVGVAGHSQGAGGSVRAATAAGSPIDTIITVELPNQIFTFPPATKGFDPSQLRVPALFFGGSDDALISGPETNRAFFDSVPGGAAMAVLTGADHNVIQHSAGRFPGFFTAWMRYQLMDDAQAAAAFTGRHPELLTSPGWTHQAIKGLTAPVAPVAPTPQSATIQQPPTTTTIPMTSTSTSTTTVLASHGALPKTGRSTPVTWSLVLLGLALLLRRTHTPQRGGGGGTRVTSPVAATPTTARGNRCRWSRLRR